MTGVSPRDLARIGVCLVPEGRGVFPNLTVRENLVMMTFTGRSIEEIEDIAYTRFPILGKRVSQTAGTMSGGEQQMLALARGLATDPAVLMLDELSMGLAPRIVAELYEHVAEAARRGSRCWSSNSSPRRCFTPPITPRCSSAAKSRSKAHRTNSATSSRPSI